MNIKLNTSNPLLRYTSDFDLLEKNINAKQYTDCSFSFVPKFSYSIYNDIAFLNLIFEPRSFKYIKNISSLSELLVEIGLKYMEKKLETKELISCQICHDKVEEYILPGCQEVPHYICVNCFIDYHKDFFNSGSIFKHENIDTLKCHYCREKYKLSESFFVKLID